MNKLFRALLFILTLTLSAVGVGAGLVRLEIRERAPFAGGHSFGAPGAYERITGRMFLEVNPDNPTNARISDLRFASRNANCCVECWTDFFLLKPLDARRGDPRPAVRERYPTREVYLARMTEAALQLKRRRFLLDEDATAILQIAAERNVWDAP